MSIDAFHKREVILDLKEKLLLAAGHRLSGQPTSTLDSAYERLIRKIDG